MNKNQVSQLAWRFGWLSLVVLSAYYLYRAINYRFLTPNQLGPTLFNKQIWYFAHLIVALPVIVGAPLQFVPTLRNTRPKLHRWVGRFYVGGAILAALLAIYLGGIVGEYEGSRLSIVLLATTWIFFTVAAWRCAVNKKFEAHRQFMIRSYGMALVLVWLRLMYQLQDWLFFYVKDEAMRDATREWASWIVPLLIIELWLSWAPMLRTGKSTASKVNASLQRTPMGSATDLGLKNTES